MDDIVSDDRGTDGWRAYAVGDVHGRADLLDTLLGLIEADHQQRSPARLLLVMLGDLIDRGPSSREVVERLRTYDPQGGRLVCLLGNHEEVLLRILNGERGLVHDWLQFGGSQCLESYGLDARAIDRMEERDALRAIKNAIPTAHAQFVSSFVDTLRFGDYLFVHAGIRPGVSLEDQRQVDLRWIRQDFLDHDQPLGVLVVHGHTVTPQVEQKIHRIGIDTGAYRTGTLSAVAIENNRRWFLSTVN